MIRSSAVLALFLILCLGTGYLGSIATARSVADWYPLLEKPPWTPPAWVFAPVWTTLFVLMAIAAWLVWKEAGFRDAAPAFGVFGLQLGLNLLWSVLFFGIERPGAAFLEILLLWPAILATILLFRRYSRAASLLLVPYWIWVGFAAYLNGGIWVLNS